MATSSFQKRGASKSNLIKGTKPSIHNSQLLISSGISSFDDLIGGGIPVGSLVLLNEDECGGYAKFFLKYFLAEGIVCRHATFVCSQITDPKKMVQQLPNPVDADIEDDDDENVGGDKMKIAWRYESMKSVNFKYDNHIYFGHHFDLSKAISNNLLEKSDIEYWSKDSETSGESFQETNYWHLLMSIKEKLTKGKHFSSQEAAERNILRIVLHQLDSPLWMYDCKNESNTNSVYLYKFLYALRGLIRNAFATCFITLPFSKFKTDHEDKCIHLCDIAVQLQVFGPKLENLMPYKDYHGFFIVQKLAAINSMVAYNPGVSNYVFKLKRKKLVIEEFHLPPELEETEEREQDDTAVLTCSSSKSSKLDF